MKEITFHSFLFIFGMENITNFSLMFSVIFFSNVNVFQLTFKKVDNLSNFLQGYSFLLLEYLETLSKCSDFVVYHFRWLYIPCINTNLGLSLHFGTNRLSYCEQREQYLAFYQTP